MARIGMVSLGCSKNLVDSENMLGLLREAGHEITPDPSLADVLIVNTCGFIEEAKKESIKAIIEMGQYKAPGGGPVLIVAGCLAERYRDELIREMPEIDSIIGVGEVANIAGVVENTLAGERIARFSSPVAPASQGADPAPLPRMAITPQYSAYLRIADGCSNRCSYCAIPGIRGPLRSKPEGTVLAEARRLAASGVREVVLVAQDTTVYGTDIYGVPRLPALLRKLAGIEGIHWLRLMYCYPSRVSDELVEVIADEPRVCKYIDMPVQHASSRILKAMNRSHDGEDALRAVKMLREAVPGIAIRTTLMVGFPGETEEDFEELLSFMGEARFDRAGVFKYSPEEGTRAASMPSQVRARLKAERYRRAMSLQKQISTEINRSLVGAVAEVLIERELRPGRWLGRSWRDAPEVDGIVRLSGSGLSAGSFVNAEITGYSAYDLKARAVSSR